MYLDRIFSPPNLVGLEHSDIKDIKVLTCKKCGEILGTPYIYAKEKRKAFRIYQDAIEKEIRKLR